MRVVFFQAYRGTPNTPDPGYADFQVDIAGARVTGTSNPDGSLPRYLRRASRERFEAPGADRNNRLFIKLRPKAAAELAPRIESVLKSYLASRAIEHDTVEA
jgi:hypothetical protein